MDFYSQSTFVPVQRYTLTACGYIELLAKRGCAANAYAYSAIIKSFCKGGMIGLQLLHNMTERSISPDTVTYTLIIDGLCHVGRWEDMRKLVHEMIDRKMMSLNVITFNVLVNML